MPKAKKPYVDLAIAGELNKELSPFTLTLKHIKQLDSRFGGFCFGYLRDGVVCYDTVAMKSKQNGLRLKPVRFLMPGEVEKQLQKKYYRYWYFFDRDYLYPLTPTKVKTLFDAFLFVVTNDPLYRTAMIADYESPFIRKKPLIAMRPKKAIWECSVPQEEFTT